MLQSRLTNPIPMIDIVLRGHVLDQGNRIHRVGALDAGCTGLSPLDSRPGTSSYGLRRQVLLTVQQIKAS